LEKQLWNRKAGPKGEWEERGNKKFSIVSLEFSDFVLFRPNNPASEKKAEKAIKELVVKRNASKQRSQTRKAKATDFGKRSGTQSKSRSGRRNPKAGKKASRSGSRSP